MHKTVPSLGLELLVPEANLLFVQTFDIPEITGEPFWDFYRVMDEQQKYILRSKFWGMYTPWTCPHCWLMFPLSIQEKVTLWLHPLIEDVQCPDCEKYTHLTDVVPCTVMLNQGMQKKLPDPMILEHLKDRRFEAFASPKLDELQHANCRLLLSMWETKGYAAAKKLLTKEEFRQVNKEGFIDVHSNRHYRVYMGHHSSLGEIQNGAVVRGWCLHFGYNTPLFDNMAAHVLALKSTPEEHIARAIEQEPKWLMRMQKDKSWPIVVKKLKRMYEDGKALTFPDAKAALWYFHGRSDPPAPDMAYPRNDEEAVKCMMMPEAGRWFFPHMHAMFEHQNAIAMKKSSRDRLNVERAHERARERSAS